MIIEHNEFLFDVNSADLQKVNIQLALKSNPTQILWYAELQGLWQDFFSKPTADLMKIWGMHNTGDYFQQNLRRYDKILHPRVSYTAIFHEMIKKNWKELDFIKNIYSTSLLNWLSMGYGVEDDSLNFWQKQTHAGLAEFIEEEQRYKALL